MKQQNNIINYICYVLMAFNALYSVWNHELSAAFHISATLLFMRLWHIEIGKNKVNNIYADNVGIKINQKDQ